MLFLDLDMQHLINAQEISLSNENTYNVRINQCLYSKPERIFQPIIQFSYKIFSVALHTKFEL